MPSARRSTSPRQRAPPTAWTQPYFARLDAGPVTQDETYWLSGPTGTIWTNGNDGAGSGMEADTVDGLSSAQFLRSDAADQATGLITFQGDPTGTGANQGSVYVNPATAAANETLVGVSDNGSARFRIDKEGDTEVLGNFAAGNGGSLATNVAAYPGLVQSTSGVGWGVYATAQDIGTGGGSITGVYGSGWASGAGNGKNAYGVYGTATGATGTNYGVYGTAADVGVYGTSASIGVWGVGGTAGGYFDDSNTSSYAYVGTGTNKILGSGSVSFVQNHPSLADRVIVYHAPEGDEVATYTRGSAKLAGGVAHVRLGETFAWVTNPDIGLTAHVTPRGNDAGLYVESITTSELVVRSADGASDAAFDYVVYGLRIGFEEVAIVGEKRRDSPIPSMAGHRRLYEAHPELRRFAALHRYQRMRAEAGAAAPLDTIGAKALHDAIGESAGGANPEPRRTPELRREPATGEPTPPATTGRTASAERPGIPVDADGNLYGRSVRTSLPDLAQYVPASGPVEAGDLLAIDPRDPARVRVSDAASDPAVVGIAAGEPGVALEGGMAPITAADAALSARLEAARAGGDREEASRVWQELLGVPAGERSRGALGDPVVQGGRAAWSHPRRRPARHVGDTRPCHARGRSGSRHGRREGARAAGRRDRRHPRARDAPVVGRRPASPFLSDAWALREIVNLADRRRTASTIPGMRARPMMLAAALLALAAAAALGQDAEPPAIDFVCYIPDLGAEISAAEAEKHMRLYAAFLEEQGVARATVKLMATVKDLEAYVLARDPKRPTFGVLHPLVVGLMREPWGLEVLAMPVQDGSPLASRVVVAMRGSGIEKMEDLRGKSLVITKPFEELPELLGLLLWGKPERADVALGKLLLAETSAQAAVAVMQRKADAAFVNGYVYNTSRKQVKQVWQNLEEVGQTPPMHLAPVVAFKGAPPELTQKLTAAILKAGGSKAGKELLEAFRIEEFRPMTVEDLAGVEGKMLEAMKAARTAAAVTVTSTQRMGTDVGVTFVLPAALPDGEKAVARYRAGEGAEATATLRCITRTCTGMLAASAAQRVSVAIFAIAADGTERHVGACELTAP